MMLFRTATLLFAAYPVAASSLRGQSENGKIKARHLQEDVMTVFTTSTTHKISDFGGLSGADDICQSLADDAGLAGTYKAWLSDSTASPSSRFLQSPVPYVLVDGTEIAANWDDLTKGSIKNPINLDENGNKITSNKFVWTATGPGGTLYGGNSCNDWTTEDSSDVKAGNCEYTTNAWTYAPGKCSYTERLYCFEQYATSSPTTSPTSSPTMEPTSLIICDTSGTNDMGSDGNCERLCADVAHFSCIEKARDYGSIGQIPGRRCRDILHMSIQNGCLPENFEELL